MSNSIVFNEDCMVTMSQYPDNYFDLAICDIPYNIKVCDMAYVTERKATVKQKNGTRLSPYKCKKKHLYKEWDNVPPPSQEYFDLLTRISKNQIIFGIDYVNWVEVGTGRIKWNKCVADGMSFKTYENAYCSAIENEVEIQLLWSGMMQAKSLTEPTQQQGNKKLNEKRIHICQKPILLYKKLILEYGFKGMKIYDSHVGSGSSRIAADELECEFVGSEIDSDHFQDQENRYRDYKSQLCLTFKNQ